MFLMAPLVSWFVLLQSLCTKLRIKGEGSAGELQLQEQEQQHLPGAAEDQSAGAAHAQLHRSGLQGAEPL